MGSCPRLLLDCFRHDLCSHRCVPFFIARNLPGPSPRSGISRKHTAWNSWCIQLRSVRRLNLNFQPDRLLCKKHSLKEKTWLHWARFFFWFWAYCVMQMRAWCWFSFLSVKIALRCAGDASVDRPTQTDTQHYLKLVQSSYEAAISGHHEPHFVYSYSWYEPPLDTSDNPCKN